jgi:hypothetical protein
MDPILTGLIVVVVVQFVWLYVINQKLQMHMGKGAPPCCAENKAKLKELWDWVNDSLKPALATCVTPNANCDPGSGDPWPPKGPGNF